MLKLWVLPKKRRKALKCHLNTSMCFTFTLAAAGFFFVRQSLPLRKVLFPFVLTGAYLFFFRLRARSFLRVVHYLFVWEIVSNHAKKVPRKVWPVCLPSPTYLPLVSVDQFFLTPVFILYNKCIWSYKKGFIHF